ncbi:MAG: DNA internalization-related competence protein ComEC/Rec2 [Candidatus Methylumidiphilus sp.]
MADHPSSIRRCLALVAGVLAAQQFQSLPSLAAMALCALAGGLLWRSRLAAPGAFLLGLAWALAVGASRLDDGLDKRWERQDIIAEGVVENVPDVMDDGLRFIFRPDTIVSPADAELPKRWRLSWFKDAQAVKAGQRWRLRVRLKRPHGLFNPGGSDYELWLFGQGISATGYVGASVQNEKLAEASPFAPAAWRQALYDRMAQTLAGRDMAGVVLALTIGAESAISQAQWDVLRRTGTAHLVAISGSHISLVAGLVFVLAGRLGAGLGLMRFAPPTLAALAALAAAWLYSALAAFPIPTLRTLLMIAVVMGGIALRRNVNPWHTLALALLAVALSDPPAVLSVGFWLSYGAVALILFGASGRLGAGGWWRELWKINWATSLGLAPLLLFFFQQVSLASPLANLFAVPTMGLVLTPLCLLGALLLVVYPPAGAWLLRFDETLLEWIWLVLQGLSDQPWAQWNHAAPPLWALPLALVGAVLLLAPRGIPARGLGLVLLIPALTLRPVLPEPGHFRLTLLDVGQGLAAVVQTAGHTLVFDTGPRFSKSFDTGAAVVEPFLRQQGVERIDWLVVSHGDNDHIGGADSLLKKFSIGQIHTSVPAELPGAVACQAGQTVVWDGVRFDMLAPISRLAKENDNSCVLRVSAPSGSALLTGDIEWAGEQLLLARYGVGLKSDILIAPHHGSKTSSSADFLAQVRPDIVLIPVGYLNRFHFPHPEVLRRFHALPANVLDSAQAGAITVEPGVSPPQAYRQTHGHYWNAR